MAHKRKYKEYLVDEFSQPSKATKYRRIADSENTSRIRCRVSYKSYLKCSCFQKERRLILKEPASEGPRRHSHSVQVMELPSTSEQESTFIEISGDQQDVQMQTEEQPASEGPSGQSHSIQVMELPSTSEQDSTFIEISGDQQDVQMQTEEISKRQPEENISVTAADLPEVTNEKADPLLNGDDPVYPGAPLTKGQSLLLLMSYILRHNLTAVSVHHLLKIFKEHFPGMVPVTTYLFQKAYGQYGSYELHFYCPTCENYLGVNTGELKCDICCTVTDSDSCLKSGSFFLVLNLASQVKTLFEQKQTSLKRDGPVADTISDIQCGDEYQKLKESGAMGKDDISLIWNCDGIPVFNSSKYQIWPIQCQVIELEPRERKENICLPCLWFGGKKTCMMTFLKPFVDELSFKKKNGIKWKDSGRKIFGRMSVTKQISSHSQNK